MRAEQSEGDAKKFPVGIGDDMAQMSVVGGSVLITTDMLLEGVHFDLKSCSLQQAGYKAMAVSLSDCAAMATEPTAAVVSVALRKEFGGEELKQLHKGITKAGEMFGCELIGGDITRWDKPLVINVSMVSEPIEGVEPVRRDGAKAGDIICATGSLGGSLLGLAKINSMIDISDGLSCDLNRICDQSGVGAVIEADRIPTAEIIKNEKDALLRALNDGEDFELLFTLEKEQYEKLKADWKRR